MTYLPEPRDFRYVDDLERAISLNPDKIIKAKCFNKEEADWVREQLLKRGIDQDRFFCSWLEFSNAKDN